MAVSTQLIVSARDMATGTFNKISSSTKRLGVTAKAVTNNLFSLQTAFVGMATGGLGLYVRESVRATDMIGKTADKIGLTTDELQELRYAANLAGVAQNQLDMGMQRFSRRLGEVAQGTGELKKTAEQYGVQLFDSEKKMRSNMDLLRDWSEVISNAESDQEALRIAFKLFDSEGAALVNMLRGGAKAMDATRAEARALGLVINEDLVRRSADANDALTKMSTVIDTRFKASLVELSPEIISAADAMSDWVEMNKDFITQDVPEKIRNTIEAVKSFDTTLSASYDGGLVQTAGLGYIGYKLFGKTPATILSALYVINRNVKEMDSLFGGDMSLGGVLSKYSELDDIFREISERWAADGRGEVDFWSGKQADSPAARRDFTQLDRQMFEDEWYPKPSEKQPDPVVPGGSEVEEYTDKQIKLRENLTREINQLTMDQYAFARAEAEAAYKEDVALADGKEELLLQALRRRQLAIESANEAEAQAAKTAQQEELRAQQELTREIERATLDQYDFQRREAERHFAELKQKAKEAGMDTVGLDAALSQRMTEIAAEEADADRRSFAALQAEAESVHLSILESSDSMIDGMELGLLRYESSFQSMAENTADLMQDSMRSVSSEIANMVDTGKFNFDDLFAYVRRKSIEMFVAEPLTKGLFSTIGSGVASMFGGMKLPGFATGGISYGPQLAMVSEGRHPVEAHVPLPDGRSIPVSISGSMPAQSVPPVVIQLVGQDGRIMHQTKAQPRFDGRAFVTREDVSILFQEGVAQNTAGLGDFLRNGGA
ncbi:MAG: hypothetical protein CL942_05860 [Desulfovibrio sp.]|nr:hypothetical protein [Desulfovibrio sp.]|tara:strand:+ start:4843 stop:7176 length:2334 start_codon:yes stop_codon:yes gene_type:complete